MTEITTEKQSCRHESHSVLLDICSGSLPRRSSSWLLMARAFETLNATTWLWKKHVEKNWSKCPWTALSKNDANVDIFADKKYTLKAPDYDIWLYQSTSNMVGVLHIVALCPCRRRERTSLNSCTKMSFYQSFLSNLSGNIDIPPGESSVVSDTHLRVVESNDKLFVDHLGNSVPRVLIQKHVIPLKEHDLDRGRHDDVVLGRILNGMVETRQSDMCGRSLEFCNSFDKLMSVECERCPSACERFGRVMRCCEVRLWVMKPVLHSISSVCVFYCFRPETIADHWHDYHIMQPIMVHTLEKSCT